MITGADLGDRQRYCLGHSRVVSGVGRGKGDRKRVGARGRNATSGRSVDQRAGDRGGCIQLDVGERRSINDIGRRSPRDDGSSLRDRQRDGLGDSGVVGGIGRGKGDRERIGASCRNTTDRRSIDKRAGNGSRRIELGRRERSSVRDCCRWIPGNDRSRLRDDDLNGLCDARVVGSVRRSKGDRERIGTNRGNRSGSRSVDKRARIRCSRVELRAGECRAIR